MIFSYIFILENICCIIFDYISHCKGKVNQIQCYVLFAHVSKVAMLQKYKLIYHDKKKGIVSKENLKEKEKE